MSLELDQAFLDECDTWASSIPDQPFTSEKELTESIFSYTHKLRDIVSEPWETRVECYKFLIGFIKAGAATSANWETTLWPKIFESISCQIVDQRSMVVRISCFFIVVMISMLPQSGIDLACNQLVLKLIQVTALARSASPAIAIKTLTFMASTPWQLSQAASTKLGDYLQKSNILSSKIVLFHCMAHYVSNHGESKVLLQRFGSFETMIRCGIADKDIKVRQATKSLYQALAESQVIREKADKFKPFLNSLDERSRAFLLRKDKDSVTNTSISSPSASTFDQSLSQTTSTRTPSYNTTANVSFANQSLTNNSISSPYSAHTASGTTNAQLGSTLASPYQKSSSASNSDIPISARTRTTTPSTPMNDSYAAKPMDPSLAQAQFQQRMQQLSSGTQTTPRTTNSSVIPTPVQTTSGNLYSTNKPRSVRSSTTSTPNQGQTHSSPATPAPITSPFSPNLGNPTSTPTANSNASANAFQQKTRSSTVSTMNESDSMMNQITSPFSQKHGQLPNTSLDMMHESSLGLGVSGNFVVNSNKFLDESNLLSQSQFGSTSFGFSSSLTPGMGMGPYDNNESKNMMTTTSRPQSQHRPPSTGPISVRKVIMTQRASNTSSSASLPLSTPNTAKSAPTKRESLSYRASSTQPTTGNGSNVNTTSNLNTSDSVSSHARTPISRRSSITGSKASQANSTYGTSTPSTRSRSSTLTSPNTHSHPASPLDSSTSTTGQTQTPISSCATMKKDMTILCSTLTTRRELTTRLQTVDSMNTLIRDATKTDPNDHCEMTQTKLSKLFRTFGSQGVIMISSSLRETALDLPGGKLFERILVAIHSLMICLQFPPSLLALQKLPLSFSELYQAESKTPDVISTIVEDIVIIIMIALTLDPIKPPAVPLDSDDPNCVTSDETMVPIIVTLLNLILQVIPLHPLFLILTRLLEYPAICRRHARINCLEYLTYLLTHGTPEELETRDPLAPLEDNMHIDANGQVVVVSEGSIVFSTYPGFRTLVGRIVSLLTENHTVPTSEYKKQSSPTLLMDAGLRVLYLLTLINEKSTYSAIHSFASDQVVRLFDILKARNPSLYDTLQKKRSSSLSTTMPLSNTLSRSSRKSQGDVEADVSVSVQQSPPSARTKSQALSTIPIPTSIRSPHQASVSTTLSPAMQQTGKSSPAALPTTTAVMTSTQTSFQPKSVITVLTSSILDAPGTIVPPTSVRKLSTTSAHAHASVSGSGSGSGSVSVNTPCSSSSSKYPTKSSTSSVASTKTATASTTVASRNVGHSPHYDSGTDLSNRNFLDESTLDLSDKPEITPSEQNDVTFSILDDYDSSQARFLSPIKPARKPKSASSSASGFSPINHKISSTLLPEEVEEDEVEETQGVTGVATFIIESESKPTETDDGSDDHDIDADMNALNESIMRLANQYYLQPEFIQAGATVVATEQAPMQNHQQISLPRPLPVSAFFEDETEAPHPEVFISGNQSPRKTPNSSHRSFYIPSPVKKHMEDKNVSFDSTSMFYEPEEYDTNSSEAVAVGKTDISLDCHASFVECVPDVVETEAAVKETSVGTDTNTNTNTKTQDVAQTALDFHDLFPTIPQKNVVEEPKLQENHLDDTNSFHLHTVPISFDDSSISTEHPDFVSRDPVALSGRTGFTFNENKSRSAESQGSEHGSKTNKPSHQKSHLSRYNMVSYEPITNDSRERFLRIFNEISRSGRERILTRAQQDIVILSPAQTLERKKRTERRYQELPYYLLHPLISDQEEKTLAKSLIRALYASFKGAETEDIFMDHTRNPTTKSLPIFVFQALLNPPSKSGDDETAIDQLNTSSTILANPDVNKQFIASMGDVERCIEYIALFLPGVYVCYVVVLVLLREALAKPNSAEIQKCLALKALLESIDPNCVHIRVALPISLKAALKMLQASASQCAVMRTLSVVIQQENVLINNYLLPQTKNGENSIESYNAMLPLILSLLSSPSALIKKEATMVFIFLEGCLGESVIMEHITQLTSMQQAIYNACKTSYSDGKL